MARELEILKDNNVNAVDFTPGLKISITTDDGEVYKAD